MASSASTIVAAPTSAGQRFVRVDRIGEAPTMVAVITLQRPKALNALTRALLEQLRDALQRLADEKVKVVIVTGAGRAFSAGVDLTDAQSMFQGAVQEIKDPLSVLESYPGVTIAAVNGHAITGGFELALGCDILVASTAAQFRDTHCKFGIFPSWGLSQKLSRAIGSSRARVAHFTGQPIHAGTALEWGLVAEVVEPEQLLPRSIQLAQSIAKAHPRLLVAMNQVIRDGLGKPLEEARELERQRALQYYDTMTAEDFAAMQSFIAGRRKQKPQGVGKQRTSASSAVLHQSKL